VWLRPGSDRVSTNDVDSETGDVPDRIEITAEDVADEDQPSTDENVGSGSSDSDDINRAARASPEDADDRFLSLSSNDTGRPAREGAMQEAREDSEAGGGIQATVTTIGNPLAFPGERIRIENLGPFSGNYRITSMSHQVGEGDWTTTMRLIRNGPFGSQWITDALRRRLNRDPADQEPPGQPDIGEDATSGGSTTVEPFDPYSVEGI
jgi:phage protein D